MIGPALIHLICRMRHLNSMGLVLSFHWRFLFWPLLGYISDFDSSAKRLLERLKKNYSHTERGFWGFGEALAKAQV